MPFFMYFIPSCWVASYPARWVDSYPFVGYDRTSSLGTTLPIRWVQPYPFVGYKTDHEQAQ